VLRPHGVRGALLVEAAPDLAHLITPGMRIFLGAERTPAVAAEMRPHGRQFLLLLDGVTDRQAAEIHRDSPIHLSGEGLPALPQGTYYHWDVLGLEVVSEDGEPLGRVREILKTGANDVYVVRGPTGGEILLPAIESVVLKIDLEAQRMTVHLLPGLREGGEE
jgi:16S rRNA processing protein RimM